MLLRLLQFDMASETEYYPVAGERYRNAGALPPRVNFEGRRLRDVPYLVCFLFLVIIQIALGSYYTVQGNGKTFADVYGIPEQCVTSDSGSKHFRQLAVSNMTGANYSRGTLDGAGPIFSLLGEYSGIFVGSIAFSFVLAFLWCVCSLRDFPQVSVLRTHSVNVTLQDCPFEEFRHAHCLGDSSPQCSCCR